MTSKNIQNIEAEDKKQETDGISDTPISHPLPDALPGLNIQEGIRRFGGIWDMYAELVAYFCHDKKNICVRLRQLIEDEDFETAITLAHSLKGSAATISAAKLCNAAKILEKTCESKDAVLIHEKLVPVEQTFAEIMSSALAITDVLKSHKPDMLSDMDDTECGVPSLLQLFSDLQESLRNFEPVESEFYMKKIKICFAISHFGSEASELVRDLDTQIENFDFEEAGHTLEKLIEEIKMSNNECRGA